MEEKEKVKNCLDSLHDIVNIFPFVFNNYFGEDTLR